MAETKATKKEEMVTIFVPFEDGDKDSSLFVSVNDRDFQIQRGQMVEVPRCVAEVIQNSQQQMAVAIANAEALQNSASK